MNFEISKTYYVKGEEENNICIYGETCDDYIHSCGIIYCMCGKEQLDNGDIVELITVDSLFMKLPEKVQNFMIYHEVGHIKFGHTELSVVKVALINICRRLGFLPKMEVEADCYAASMVGIEDAKLGLKFLMGDKTLSLIGRIEAFKRLLRVKIVPIV